MTNLITPRLWTLFGFQADEWRRGTAEELQASNARLILSLEDFQSLDEETRRGAADRIAVELKPAEPIDPLLPYLDRMELVALSFPAYNDGRSYSKVALLRTRHDFRGAIRATGDVLIDQISHMLRCGFSEFEVSNPVTIRRLEAGNKGGIRYHYQPAALPAARNGYAWRRLAS